MLVAGSVALDLIAQLPRYPTADEPVKVRSLVQEPGGCGGNVAVALARLGHAPTLLSAVGADFAGSAYARKLESLGVDLTRLVHVEDVLTARAVMANTPEGEQLILYHEGPTPAMDQLTGTPARLGHFAPGELTAYPTLMAPCEVVTFDPGQETFYRPLEETLACLEHVDVLFANEHESRRIAGALGGIDELLDQVPTVIVSDRDGQNLHAVEGSERVEGVPAEVVDTTGAGDAHRAGFLHGLHEGWDDVTSCRFGSAVAACVVEHQGAQGGLPDLVTALARYETAYGERPGA